MHRKRSSFATALTITITVLVSLAATAEPDALPRIHVVGDSISIQYGPYLESFLQGTFDYSRKTEETTKALGIPGKPTANGGDSSRVLEYLEAMASGESLRAEYLLINCGLHDIKTDPDTGVKQVPIEDYQSNLEKIVALAARMESKLIWVRTTPADEKVHNKPGSSFHRYAVDVFDYNVVADRIMVANDIPMIDLHAFTSTLGPDLYADHVHFPDHICEKQGAYIAGALGQFVANTADGNSCKPEAPSLEIR